MEIFTPGAATGEIVDFLPSGWSSDCDPRRGRTASSPSSRPEALNALDSENLGQLRATGVARRRRGGRVVVLTGDGQKAFIAGADIRSTLHLARATRASSRASGMIRAAARDDAEAHPRGDQRLLPRRRVRDGARLRPPLRLVDRGLRAAGDQPRAHPRLGRHAASCPSRRPRDGEGARPLGPHAGPPRTPTRTTS